MEVSIFLSKSTMWKKLFFDTIKEEKSVYEEDEYMKNSKIKWVQGALVAGAAVGVLSLGKTYGKRLATANNVTKLTHYEDYNLYKIEKAF